MWRRRGSAGRQGRGGRTGVDELEGTAIASEIDGERDFAVLALAFSFWTHLSATYGTVNQYVILRGESSYTRVCDAATFRVVSDPLG